MKKFFVEMIKQQKDWLQCACIAGNIDLAQSTISHHINQLVDADLVIAEKDGRNAKYLVNKDLLKSYFKTGEDTIHILSAAFAVSSRSARIVMCR